MTPAMLHLKGWKRVGDDLHERWLAPGVESGGGVTLAEAQAVQAMRDERARRRDAFAQAALQATLRADTVLTPQEVAALAIAYADALITALDEKK